MSFGSRLRDKRKELGITQPELAEKLGVSQSAIGSWETDVNSPRATLLYDLFDILQCDANYLFQDEAKQLYKDEASPEEFEKLVKKYRELDSHGKDMVDIVLQKEYERIVELHNSTPALEETTKEPDNIITIDPLSTQQMEEELLPDAANDRNATEEEKKHADGIMFDDSEWE
mgnify:CR=1 FL=1|jgi:repressor LexA